MSKGDTIKQRQDKAEYAYKFYLNQGWTPEQSAGIVGNLLMESGLDPKIHEKRGGDSVGIAQWRPDRLKTLKSKYGDKWTDFHNQLAFVDWELKNSEKSAGEALKKVKGVWEAGRVVSDLYERPKVRFNANDKRQKFVSDTYTKYGKKQLTAEDSSRFINSAIAGAPTQSSFQTNDIDTRVEAPIFAQNTNLASVPDTPTEEKKTESEAVKQLKEQQVEKNFLQDFYTQQKQQIAQQQEEEQPQIQKVAPIDVIGTYSQAKQFVEQPLSIAQEGRLMPGTPEYEKAYNDYNVFNYDKNSDTYVGRELNPVVVKGKPKQKGFWNEYFDNVAREHAQDGVLGAIVGTTFDAVAGLPQKAMTYAFTNKVQTPSQAMNIQNPVGAFAVDAVTDPMNLVGAGLLTKEKVLSNIAKNAALPNMSDLRPFY